MVPPSPRTDQILPKTEPLPFPLLDGNVSQTGGNIAKQARKCNLFTYKLLVYPQRLRCRGAEIPVKNGINVFQNIRAHIEKVPFVFYGD